MTTFQDSWRSYKNALPQVTAAENASRHHAFMAGAACAFKKFDEAAFMPTERQGEDALLKLAAELRFISPQLEKTLEKIFA